MIEHLAQCSCGQLRAFCAGDPVRVSVCHCDSCKTRTGSAFSFNATFPADRVRTEGRFETYARETDTGRQNRFRFCPACGATVIYDIDARPGMISIAAGTFVDHDIPAPTIEVYAHRRVDWCALDPQIVAEDR